MTTWQGTRACRGCDGSGFDYKHPDLSTFDSFEDCMVCGGTGRVEAKPPVSDALADAETLRRFCDANLYSRDFPLFSSYPLIAIWKAGNSGWTRRSINRGREHEAWSRTECQARAAFRAIPGLRG